MRGPLMTFAAAALALAACQGPRPAKATPAPAQEAVTPTPTPTAVQIEPAKAPSTQAARGPIRVAITFDDLPAHGPLPPGRTRADIHQSITTALKKHDVPAVHGFVNGEKLEQAPGDRAVLAAWKAAGHHLADHTYSHPDLGAVGADAFIADIERNAKVLAALAGDDPEAQRHARTFRYPYLRQGRDLSTRTAVRTYLAEHDYRVAEVTIDFGDWAWNQPYARCLARSDEHSLQALRRSFLANAVVFLRWSDAAAQTLWGRPVAHVLLLHVGAFDAVVLDELLTRYEKAGVTWITLDEALRDPIYELDIPVVGKYGGTLLEQYIEGATPAPAHPPFPRQPLALLDAVCR